MPAQDGTAARFKLRKFKGFDDVVICTDVQQIHSVGNLGPSRHHNYWGVHVPSAKATQKIP